MTSATSTDHNNIATPPGGEVVGLAEWPPVAAPAVPYLKLLLFYLPLAFSGFIMTLDMPVIYGVLNRLPDPDTSVAALRVAFSLALVYEASHISMIDVSTAMSTDRRVFSMLGRFYGIMAAVLLVVASIIVFSPIYDFIVQDVMNIPAGVAEAARAASVVFLFWPIPIGWRRLCQGALIRSGESKPVGAGGLVRMGSLAISLSFFVWLGTSVVHIGPATIGVLAMLVSVTAEALAVQGWTNRVLRKMPETTPDQPAPTYRDVWSYFFPLGASSVMSTLMQPLLTAGIASVAIAWASTGGPVVAVASYAIAWSLASPVFGPTFSMTQASIAWRKSPDPSVRERGTRVLVAFGVGLAALMAIVSLTPIVYWLFTALLGASPETAALAVDVMRWLIPVPVLYTISFMLRGRLIALGRPTAVRRAQLIDLAALFIVVLLAASGPVAALLHGAPAAPFASVAFNLVLCVDISILALSLRALGRRAKA